MGNVSGDGRDLGLPMRTLPPARPARVVADASRGAGGHTESVAVAAGSRSRMDVRVRQAIALTGFLAACGIWRLSSLHEPEPLTAIRPVGSLTVRAMWREERRIAKCG